MADLFTYLLKVNIALSLFYLIYRLWLRNLTFYRTNRHFLIFSVLFATLYPLVNWNWFDPNATIAPQVATMIPIWEYQYSAQQEVTISEYLIQLFYLTLLVFAFRLCISLWGILRIHLSSSASIWKAYRYRRSDENILPFSFWKNVYLNPSKHQENELEGIFRHEYVHVRQLHSFDVLLAELVLVFCWYNPFAWLFTRSIKENIEFITDSQVLASGVDKKDYQFSLLRILGNTRQPLIANYFNITDIKKRISMMNKKQTPRFHIIKYLLLIPAIVTCLSAFTISKAKHPSLVPQEMLSSVRALNVLKPARADQPITFIDTVKTDTTKTDTVKTTTDSTDKKKQSILIVRHDGNHKDLHHRPEPLYIIDGEVKTTGDMSSIDPNTIESIDVLKGENAVDKYGKEAKDGVILITTKKKKEKQAEATE